MKYRPQRFVLRDTILHSFLEGTAYSDGSIMITDKKNLDGTIPRIYLTKEQVEALEGFIALRKHNE